MRIAVFKPCSPLRRAGASALVAAMQKALKHGFAGIFLSRNPSATLRRPIDSGEINPGADADNQTVLTGKMNSTNATAFA